MSPRLGDVRNARFWTVEGPRVQAVGRELASIREAKVLEADIDNFFDV